MHIIKDEFFRLLFFTSLSILLMVFTHWVALWGVIISLVNFLLRDKPKVREIEIMRKKFLRDFNI